MARKQTAATGDEIRSWAAIVPLWPHGGRAYGLGRSKTFELAYAGEFPVTVRRIGSQNKVVTSEIMADLGIEQRESTVDTAA